MIIPTNKKGISIYVIICKNHTISFHIERTAGEEGMGRSVIVVLRTLNEAVDRVEYFAGVVYYLLWSPDGKQIGELSVSVEDMLVSSDIAVNCKFVITGHRDTVMLKPMHMYCISRTIRRTGP